MMRRRLTFMAFLFLTTLATNAQTISDGLMMAKKDFCTGVLYSNEQWKNYWEGSVKRDNQNLGTVTTTQLMWFGNYGLTDKINFIAMVPYVKTSASAGTLIGLEGWQDMTFAAKWKDRKSVV